MDAGVGGRVVEYETDEEEFLGEEYGSTELAKHPLISVPTPVPARGAPAASNKVKERSCGPEVQASLPEPGVDQDGQGRQVGPGRQEQPEEGGGGVQKEERTMGWLEPKSLFIENGQNFLVCISFELVQNQMV
jgi:hypothetical protein